MRITKIKTLFYLSLMPSGEMDYAVCICIEETCMMRIVVLQIGLVVRDCEILLSVTKETFDELSQLLQIFEQSISNASDTDKP